MIVLQLFSFKVYVQFHCFSYSVIIVIFMNQFLFNKTQWFASYSLATVPELNYLSTRPTYNCMLTVCLHCITVYSYTLYTRVACAYATLVHSQLLNTCTQVCVDSVLITSSDCPINLVRWYTSLPDQ